MSSWGRAGAEAAGRAGARAQLGPQSSSTKGPLYRARHRPTQRWLLSCCMETVTVLISLDSTEGSTRERRCQSKEAGAQQTRVSQAWPSDLRQCSLEGLDRTGLDGAPPSLPFVHILSTVNKRLMTFARSPILARTFCCAEPFALWRGHRCHPPRTLLVPPHSALTAQGSPRPPCHHRPPPVSESAGSGNLTRMESGRVSSSASGLSHRGQRLKAHPRCSVIGTYSLTQLRHVPLSVQTTLCVSVRPSVHPSMGSWAAPSSWLL